MLRLLFLAAMLAAFSPFSLLAQFDSSAVLGTITDASGAVREETGLDELLAWADVIVVVTAHKAIDWPRVYDGAELIVDTVDSSRGRSMRERQVLRLGAGWSTTA